MKKTAVLALALAVVFAVSAFAEKPTATLPLLTGTITVDGSIADWTACGLSPLAIDKKAQVAIGGLNWLGAQKQSSKVYVAFTEDAVYIAAVVKAPKSAKNSKEGKNIYDGNAVELFVGFDNSDPQREIYTESDYQIGFSTGDYSKANKKFSIKPQIYCFNLDKPVEGGKIVVKPATDGYTLEAMVPASALDGWDIRDGAEIGFDIGIDDIGDKGVVRKIQMTWSGDKDGWKNPKGWGKAVLKAKSCE
ncbi:MAG: hypothetical protein LLG37_00795 [Spirochaetia bacterium]|nr:hypothetical protein [Spirochaetia bacterium]